MPSSCRYLHVAKSQNGLHLECSNRCSGSNKIVHSVSSTMSLSSVNSSKDELTPRGMADRSQRPARTRWASESLTFLSGLVLVPTDTTSSPTLFGCLSL
eukprot:2366399-Amphidinium_carterae.1